MGFGEVLDKSVRIRRELVVEDYTRVPFCCSMAKLQAGGST